MAVLQITFRSLMANYPNLAEEPEPTEQRSEEDAYVDAVLHHAQALQRLLRSYQEAVERQLNKRPPENHSQRHSSL
jgi:hypothetical protein